MAYQALYRKWRPGEFEDVKGQDHIVTTLRNQIKANRIGHAYLFCGTRGTGKTTVAKIFAKSVNCEHPVDGSPCEECETCRAISAGVSMNVIEIDAASNNGVENIREIRNEVQYSPTQGKYKVYIIDEVHMLSIGAFNALLKTLEEPPSYVIFILATTESHKIPITILSRCQRYDFKRISIDTIADRLSELMVAENIHVEDRAIRYVAKAADGSMRDALSLLDQCIAFYLGQDLKYENVLEVLGAVDTEVFEKMLEKVLSYDSYGCIKLIEDIVMQGRDLGQFVGDFVWYLRNLLLVKTTDDEEKLTDIIDMSADNLAVLKEISKKTDVDTLMLYIRQMSELSSDLKFSTQKRIRVETAFIKMTRPVMGQKEDFGEILGRVALLEELLKDTTDKLKSGQLGVVMAPSGVNASENEGAYNGNKNAEAQVSKRVVEALPEDVEKVVKNWKNILRSIDELLMVQFLNGAKVTLADDGESLEIVFSSKVGYNYFAIPENDEMLVKAIEEKTGLHIKIIYTKISSDEDFQNRFTDIRELVNMEIEIDDKEDLI